MSESCSQPRRIRSITRPGVPTTICGPWRSCTVCSGIGWPPKTATTLTPLCSENVRSACATWMQSSRVGVEHEHLDVLGRLVDLLDGRQPEGRGLAAARLRLADDVAAAHDHRDRLDLDRRGLAVLERLDGVERALRKAEFGESGHCLPPWFTYRHGGAAGSAGSAVAPLGACTAERGAHSPSAKGSSPSRLPSRRAHPARHRPARRASAPTSSSTASRSALPPGERLALIGRNGAGKTTLLRMHRRRDRRRRRRRRQAQGLPHRPARPAPADRRRATRSAPTSARAWPTSTPPRSACASSSAAWPRATTRDDVLRSYAHAQSELESVGGYAWRARFE